MPKGDQTGPAGQGSMTGRGMGYCAGNDRPGFMEPGPGAGRGLGRGVGRTRGRGRATMYNPRGMLRPRFQRAAAVQPQLVPAQQNYPQTEKEVLEEDKKSIEQELGMLKKELDEINKRLDEME